MSCRFQFDCSNTLNDQLLENVSVELEPSPETEGWAPGRVFPLDKLPYGTPGKTYVLLEIPSSNAVTASFTASLKFQVKDVDPNTNEVESDECYDDNFAVSDFCNIVHFFGSCFPLSEVICSNLLNIE